MNAVKAASSAVASGAVASHAAPQGLPSLPSKAMWEFLTNDSGAGVMLCDTGGRILYVNDRFAKFVNQAAADAMIGKALADIYPETAAHERLEIIRRSARERRSIVVESVWNGVAYQSILRPLGAIGGDAEMVLVLSRHQPRKEADEPPSTVERVALKSNNMGPLSRLTARELELLALIGEGLSTHDIAKRISRSIKTVEAHRASLGKKLGVASRVALAKIAGESNLSFDLLQARQAQGGRLAQRNGDHRNN